MGLTGTCLSFACRLLGPTGGSAQEAGFGTHLPEFFVPDHPSARYRARLILAAANAVLFEFPHDPPCFRDRQPKQAGQRRHWHGLATQQEDSAAVGLMHETDQLEPDAAGVVVERLDGDVFAPVARIKLESR